MVPYHLKILDYCEIFCVLMPKIGEFLLKRIALLFLFTVFSLTSHAVEVKGVYESVVPIAGQEAEERDVALQLGFVDVLVRVTGDVFIADEPLIQPEIKNVAKYVSRFQYQENTKEDALTRLNLYIKFDKGAIANLLRDKGLPIWPVNRPEVLVWIAIEDGSNRFILSPDSDQDIRNELVKIAKKRGVPVITPLMDINDMGQIRFSDIWAGFKEEVLTASKRYGDSHVLVGRLFRAASGNWDAKWTFWGMDSEENWNGSGVDVSTAMTSGIDGLIGVLSKYYALTPGNDSKTGLDIIVDGIDTTSEYAGVLKYLESQAGVVAIKVVSVKGSRVSYQIVIEGQTDLFFNAIDSGNYLLKVQGMVSEHKQEGDEQPETFYVLVE